MTSTKYVSHSPHATNASREAVMQLVKKYLDFY